MVVRRSSAARPTVPSSEDSRIQVPKLNKDPVWSLRPWPVEIEVAGITIEIPALPATDWLSYLMQAEPDLDMMATDLVPDLEEMVYDEELDLDQFYETILEVVSCVSARPWWVALRLVAVARGQWDILGPQLIERGADPNVLSLSAWLDVLLVTVLAAMDSNKVTMFTMQLEIVPDLGSGKSSGSTLDDMEMDQGAFLSLGMGG